VSIAESSSNPGGTERLSHAATPVTPFTLRDLYVRASISGNSLAVELGHYLNIDETAFSSTMKASSLPGQSSDEADVHAKALAAILEVVVANSKASFECVRAPAPEGGVQEWWARMLSGSLEHSPSVTGRSTTGECR
jgi:hypothetical protein